MNKTVIKGFVSVKSVLEAKSREIYRIIIDRDRYDSVMASDLRVPERRQYEKLIASGAEIQFVSKDDFSELVSSEGTGGIAAEAGERIFTDAAEVISVRDGYIAVLDGIEDPFNFAYALRSLYASGVDGVILPKRNFFTASDVVIRSSAGASELIKACCVDDIPASLRALKDNGYKIYSTALADGAKDLARVKLSRPLCVVYGGERRGISREILDASDCVLKLKYPRDVHYSLPACCAVSVISFEIASKIRRQ